MNSPKNNRPIGIQAHKKISNSERMKSAIPPIKITTRKTISNMFVARKGKLKLDAS